MIYSVEPLSLSEGYRSVNVSRRLSITLQGLFLAHKVLTVILVMQNVVSSYVCISHYSTSGCWPYSKFFSATYWKENYIGRFRHILVTF